MIFSERTKLNFLLTTQNLYGIGTCAQELMETNKKVTPTTIWPIAYFYDLAKEHFHVNDRMIRRYITRGLIPPPEKDGKKAFYNPKKSKVWEFLQVVKRFQIYYNLSLDDIEDIIDKYRDQIHYLNLISALLEYEHNNPLKGPSPEYIIIRDSFLAKLREKNTHRLKATKIEGLEKKLEMLDVIGLGEEPAVRGTKMNLEKLKMMEGRLKRLEEKLNSKKS